MLFGSLILSGWNWLWVAAAGFGFGLLLAFWSYRPVQGGITRILCPALKIVGLTALAFCLLEPLWSGQRARPGANLFAIVADNSQGLQIKDRGSVRTRGQMLRELLNPQNANRWATLEQNFELRRYFFDSRLQATKDFSELSFDGRASAIGHSLRTLADRYRGQPLAGILLLTDGNATDLPVLPDLTGLPPVYPVVIGSQEPIKDIAVQQVHTTKTDFEDAPVSVQADISANGFAGSTIIAELRDLSGKKVADQTLTARKASELLAFRFQLRPEQQGLSFYRFNARAGNETSVPGQSPASSEATLVNNSTVLVVDRGHGPYRILYVSGRPNWEFKFLNRALEEDTQLQLVGLIRVAKREPKFNFLGRAGETSNPLFRGFGNQSPEDVERYDQPVLVRLNARDELELRTGFPRTPEDLYSYHAVILDDLEAEFFAADQAVLLQKFVSERGGGFLMLGGMECFQQGNYQRTPIGDMLPVYLDRIEDAEPPGPLKLELTREGFLQPWARLRDNEADEKARLQSMAPFQVLNRVRDVKPGATVISRVIDAKSRAFPALVVQRFGRGHTAAYTVGDVWRWGLHDPDAHRDMDKSWRQLVRWLVANVPNRVDLAAEPEPENPNGAISLQVRVRDAKFQPLDNANISLRVEPVMVDASDAASTNSIKIQVEPSSEPGLYHATYVPRATGGYRASVCVTNAEGVEVGRAVAGWSSDLAADEFRSLTPNLPLLQSIAQRTGGKIISAEKLEQFARDLPSYHAPIMEAWTFPIWHTPAVFAFALVTLVSEWGLRRWKGLP
jgi:uncharacterized membrane protein